MCGNIRQNYVIVLKNFKRAQWKLTTFKIIASSGTAAHFGYELQYIFHDWADLFYMLQHRIFKWSLAEPTASVSRLGKLALTEFLIADSPYLYTFSMNMDGVRMQGWLHPMPSCLQAYMLWCLMPGMLISLWVQVQSLWYQVPRPSLSLWYHVLSPKPQVWVLIKNKLPPAQEVGSRWVPSC